MNGKNLEDIDYFRYSHKINIIEKEPDYSSNYAKEDPFKCFLALEGLIHSELFKKEITDNNINELLIKIDDVIFDLKISEEASIDYETLKCFILNFSIDLNNLECMKGITGVLKLPLLKNLLAAPYYSEIKKQPYRSRSLLEVYLKKKLLKKSQDYNETDLKEFEIWLSFFLEIFRYLQENQSLKEKYIKFKKLDEDLLIIYIAKKISLIGYHFDPIIEILKLYSNKEFRTLLKIDAQIMLLYCLCKNVMPLVQRKQINKIEFQKMKENIKFLLEFYKDFNLFQFNLNFLQTWNDLFILCFCLLDALLTKKLNKYTVRNDKNIEERIKNLEKNNEFEEFSMEEPHQKIEGTLLYFSCLNFSRTKRSINNQIKAIIGHKIASLVMVYSKITNTNEFLTKYIEGIFQKPFDDEIFLMHICLNLFIRDEFLKSYNICQMVLESENLKRNKFLSIIINLCIYLNGKLLGKNEEALLYAKLNLNTYTKIMKKDYPVKLESLYAMLAFCYYHISSNCYFIADKNEHLFKALEYFEISFKINSENFLIAHCLAKTYAKLKNVESAIIYTKKAISLNRFHTESFLLLSLLFSAKNDLKMSNSIIEELITENPFNPTLYIIKAYIETEYIMNSFYKNQEEMIFFKEDSSENVQKNTKDISDMAQKMKDKKEIIAIVEKIQLALSLALGDKSNLKYTPKFFNELPKLNKLRESSLTPENYINYRNLILYSLDLLIEINIFEIANKLIDLFADSKFDEVFEYYYRGLIKEKEGKYESAIRDFDESLILDPMFYRSIIAKANIYLKVPELKNCLKAQEQLLKAIRYEENAEIIMGLAKIYTEEGNIETANDLLLKAMELNQKQPIISYDIVKDCLFDFN